jgi:quercetin dioxygenase-like cupin family protein
MAAHVISLGDRPNLEDQIERVGGMEVLGALKTTRFLGPEGEDFVSPQKPPFAYFIERPKGDVTADHSHNANRLEFVVEGKIEWREKGLPPVVYGPGTLTYVEAGTIYGYSVLEDARILIVFEKSPGMNYR